MVNLIGTIEECSATDRNCHEVDEEGVEQQPIDQTIEDSFPASDPPSWTTGREKQEDEQPTSSGQQ